MTDAAPRRFRGVIFDYGGVFVMSPYQGIAEFEAEMGYPPGSVSTVLLAGYRDGDVQTDLHRVETGELGLEEFLAGVERASTGQLGGRDFDADAYHRFLMTAPLRSHWAVVHRARELRAAGYRVGLLTNTVREWGGAWRSTIPMDLFHDVIDSSEVGLRKPDPRIYELACDRLGVEAAACVFLDDQEENVVAARALGLAGIVVDDPHDALAELDALLLLDGSTDGEADRSHP
jgi:putative hydrolase of the HAD superfamily